MLEPAGVIIPALLVIAVAYVPYVISAGLVTAVFSHPTLSEVTRIPGYAPAPGQELRERRVSFWALMVWVGVMIGVVALARAGVTPLEIGLTPPPAGRWLAEVALLYLVGDAWWYFTHRLMHHRLLFRRVHALHHHFRHATPWASWAQGPWEAAINAVPYLVLPALLPLHLWSLLGLHVVITVFAAAGHCGHEFFPAGADRRLPWRLLNAPSHHALHHREPGSNFGSLSAVWDGLMSTQNPRWRSWFNHMVQAREARGWGPPPPEPTHRPPPPGPSLALLSDLRYLLDPSRTHREAHRRYGDPFRLPSIAGPVVLTADPALIKRVFSLKGGDFKLWATDVLGTLVGPRAMNMVTGEEHARLKALVAPLVSKEPTRALAPAMERWIGEQVAALPVGRALPLHDVCQDLSRGVIVKALLGEGDKAREAALVEHIREAVRRLNPPLVFLTPLRIEGGGWLPWGRFMKARRALDTWLVGEIKRRRRSGEDGPGLLGGLLAARDDAGAALSDEEAKDQALMLIFAGYQTTGAALSWILCHLGAHPDLRAQLKSDVERLGPAPTPERILTLPRVDAVVAETLRLHPMSTDLSPRILRCPFHLGRHTVPAGTAVGVSIARCHRDPTRWREPDTFNPERFLSADQPRGVWLPFGGGVRGCIGSAFALQQLQLAAVHFALRPGWSIGGPLPARPARHNLVMGVDSALTLTL